MYRSIRLDYLGFIFYKKSPRNVSLSRYKISYLKYDKKDSTFVAVTVNPSDQFIKENLLGNFELYSTSWIRNK